MAPRGEELLHEDDWQYVEGDRNRQLWRKFNLFVYYYPDTDTFDEIVIGDPRYQKATER